MSLLGILGLILLIIGIWWLVTGSLIGGIVLIVLGVILMGGVGSRL